MIDLAVAVVLGAAFGMVVTSLVEDIITPIIAAIFGKPDFSGLTFEINGSVFRYGSFFNAVLSFVLVAAAIFFVVVKPYNMYMERRRAGPRAGAAGRQERRGRRARGDPRPHADAVGAGSSRRVGAGGATGSVARTRVPPPGGLATAEAAVHRLDAVAQAREARALPGVGAALCRRRRSRSSTASASAHTRTDGAACAPAYFATLASASEATK